MTAGDFLRNLYTDMNAAEDRAKAFQAQAIGTQNAGLVTIQRVESTLPDGEAYGRLTGFATADQDYVLCLEMRGGGTVVLGPLQNTAPTGYTLDAPLSMVGQDVFFGAEQSSSNVVTASSANTSTNVEAQHVDFTIPGSGTWTVRVRISMGMTHSAAGIAFCIPQLDGSYGGAGGKGFACSATLPGRLENSVTFTGQAAGAHTATALYRPSAAGTATPSAVVIIIDCWRVS